MCFYLRSRKISNDYRLEVFMYVYYSQLEPTSFIHAINIAGHENIPTTFNGEAYQQLPYDSCMTVEHFMGELNKPVFWITVTVSFMPKSYYEHKSQEIQYPDYMVMHKDNDYIKVQFLDSYPTDDATGCKAVAIASL